MFLKILKLIWFFSQIGALIILLYVYASMGENIIVNDADTAWVISRNSFFYGFLAILVLINTLAFIVGKVYNESQTDIKIWVFIQVIIINFFLVIAINYTNLFNSGERFDYSRLGIIIYGSIAAIGICVVSWPFYLLLKKYFFKQQV